MSIDSGNTPQAGSNLDSLATRLNSAVVHLNRQLRRSDLAIGLPTAQASALALLVNAGPDTISRLASFEHVSGPTMTRIVTALEERALVTRVRQPSDMRVVIVEATAAGRSLIAEARDRRVAGLRAALTDLTPGELQTLTDAVVLLARLVEGPIPASPPAEPGRGEMARVPHGSSS